MNRSLFPFVPFLLLVIPVLEIGVFIIVGGQIGVLYTLLGIVLTAFIGTVLLRQQGFALLAQAQSQMDQGKIPGKELAQGVMLLAAGLLLLTPGFVTDTIGFLLLVPSIRDLIFHSIKNRMVVTGMQGQSGFSSHTYGRTGGTYYESHTYGSRPGPRSSDPSIIDLDADDFDEVTNRDAISSDKRDDDSAPKRGGTPWGKS
ncbi:FxsA family protein [uncultured Cohaesibacter sp.]|uniref:FxsA family protein n=1 Tax=uncultured Cohaesibacter sp. TaxID=1002546 RepID=UPI0029C7DC06|nr:FxsA family protein [uncultured Cohaesibacter sp.]